MKDKLIRLKSNPVGIVVWLMAICAIYLFFFGASIKNDYSARERLLWVIIAVVFTLIVHELIHALVAAILCKCKVDIRVMKDPNGIPSLATMFPESASAQKKIAIYIAPLIVLTVLPTVYLIFAKQILVLVFVAMLNCIGAFYDIVDTLINVAEIKACRKKK